MDRLSNFPPIVSDNNLHIRVQMGKRPNQPINAEITKSTTEHPGKVGLANPNHPRSRSLRKTTLGYDVGELCNEACLELVLLRLWHRKISEYISATRFHGHLNHFASFRSAILHS